MSKSTASKPAPPARHTVDWTELRHRIEDAAELGLSGTAAQREAAVLRRRAEQLARPRAAERRPQSTTSETILFRVDNQVYGVESTFARETLRVPAITPLPGLPVTCRGLANVRGQIVPVFDLRPLFRIPADAGTHPVDTILVLSHDSTEFALLVDEMLGSREIGADTLRRDVPALQGQYLRGLAADGAIVLDLPAIAAALALQERST